MKGKGTGFRELRRAEEGGESQTKGEAMAGEAAFEAGGEKDPPEVTMQESFELTVVSLLSRNARDQVGMDARVSEDGVHQCMHNVMASGRVQRQQCL